MNEELLNQYYQKILAAFPEADPQQLQASLQEYMSQVPPEQMQKDVDNLLAGQAITQEPAPKPQSEMPVPPLHGQKPIPEGPEGQVITPSPPVQAQGHTQLRMPQSDVVNPTTADANVNSSNTVNVTNQGRKVGSVQRKIAQYYEQPMMFQAPTPVHHRTMDKGMAVGAGFGGLAGLLFPRLGTGRKKRILLAALGAAGGGALGGLLGAGGGLAAERFKIAGYWQNVAGFSGMDEFKRLRGEALEELENRRTYNKGLQEAKHEQAGEPIKKKKQIGVRSVGGLAGAGMGAAASLPLMKTVPRKAKIPVILGSGLIGGALGTTVGEAVRKATKHKPKVLNQEAIEAQRAKYQEIEKKYREENPFEESYQAARNITPEAIRGEDLGLIGKYLEIPEMHAAADRSIQGNKPLGDDYKGYIDKARLLEYLEKDFKNLSPDTIDPLVAKVKASPHKYFTSTTAG